MFALPLACFFESNFTYKGAVCPNAERWHLSWWQENVNGPLEQVITAERRKFLMTIAICRMLLTAIYAILKSNIPYSPDLYHFHNAVPLEHI